MKIRTLIIEDELSSQELLINFLSSHCEDVEIIGVSATVAQGKQFIETLAPDLVFLDIELEDGLGFDVLKNFSEFDFVTIFITGYDQYSIEAIKHSAFDYILKPFSIKELQNAILRVKSRIKPWNILKQIEQADNTSQIVNIADKFILKSEKGSRIITHEQIIAISADEPYSRLNLSDNSKVLIQLPLKKVLELLPESFIKIHRSYIINLNKVVNWDKGRGGHVELINGHILPISYRLKKEFLIAIKKLNIKKL